MNHDKYIEKFTSILSLRDLADSTLSNYTSYLKTYLDWLDRALDGKRPEDVSWDELRSYLLYLKDICGLNPRSINPHIAQLRDLHRYVLHKDWDSYQIPYLKFDQYLPNVPTREEIDTLIDSFTNLKHKAEIALMYSAGIRVSELSRLRYEDIHRSKMNIYISRSKNRSDRYAVLSDKALEILTLYWFRCGRPTDWLFPGQKKGTHIHKQSVYQVLKNQLAHLGWEDKGFDCHSLRHGFGLHLYESGADLIAIKDAMGHKSISSTSVYVSMGIGNGRRIISPYDFANKA